MRLQRLILIPFLIWAVDLSAQVNDYPKDYFRSPLDIPLVLSGTFGELRTNHFHSGIDIKTNGREGYKIYSTADGYISRIRVAPGGFGKAIYIDHPNGYTTVYGHLQQFTPAINEYVRQLQYEKESFTIDIYPEKDRFQVKKGEVIALSGNSGGSGGPHLHFEIRDTKTEVPINPLLFNFDVKDNIAPLISGLFLYNTGARNEGIAKQINISKQGSKYTAAPVTVPAGNVGIAIRSYDQLNDANNQNGIYSIKVYADNKLTYHFDVEKFGFDETRYINAHIDYEEKLKRGTYIQRLFVLPGNKFSGYRSKEKKGLISINVGETKDIKIEVEDVYNNRSEVLFKLTGTAPEAYPAVGSATFFDMDKENVFEKEDIKIKFPADAFYDSLFFQYQKRYGNSYSAVHQLHQPYVPVHKNYDLFIKPANLPDDLKSKAIIARKDHRGREISEGGTWEGEFLKANPRDFGQFYITVDTEPPSVTPINISEGKSFSSGGTIKFRISDDLSGIKYYYPTIDGKWIVMDYDAKNNLLTYKIDDRFEQGNREFVIRVVDERGNETVKKYNINR